MKLSFLFQQEHFETGEFKAFVTSLSIEVLKASGIKHTRTSADGEEEIRYHAEEHLSPLRDTFIEEFLTKESSHNLVRYMPYSAFNKVFISAVQKQFPYTTHSLGNDAGWDSTASLMVGAGDVKCAGEKK